MSFLNVIKYIFQVAVRYPGDGSFFASEKDNDKTFEAIISTRDLAIDICNELDNELINSDFDIHDMDR